MCTWWSVITTGNQGENILGSWNKKEYILDNTLKVQEIKANKYRQFYVIERFLKSKGNHKECGGLN